jgi:hypothetical protein
MPIIRSGQRSGANAEYWYLPSLTRILSSSTMIAANAWLGLYLQHENYVLVKRKTFASNTCTHTLYRLCSFSALA